MVGYIEGDKLRLGRDAGVAGCAPQALGERACRHLPGERVLAPARAEKQDFHAAFGRVRQRLAGVPWGKGFADMSEAARLNLVEMTVSELSAALKRTVEEAYGYVRVRGELGNVKYHSSGHIYLDLKDEKACIAGVIWRMTAQRIRLKLEAGLEVVVTGRLTTYPGQSKYQIVIDTLAPAGVGALMALVEERKRKLTAEGLFDPARKKPL